MDASPPEPKPTPRHEAAQALTYAYILVVQLRRAVAVEAQAAVLAVLAPRVMLAAHAGHHVEEVDVAAAVGVAVALAVCGEEERAGPTASLRPSQAEVRSLLLQQKAKLAAYVGVVGLCVCTGGRILLLQGHIGLGTLAQSGARVVCPCRGKDRWELFPGHDFFKEMRNHSSRKRAVEWCQVLIKEMPR